MSQFYKLATLSGSVVGFSFRDLIPLEGKDKKEKLVLRDRGPYPSSGSGPWFCAVAESSEFVPDSGRDPGPLTGPQYKKSGAYEGEVVVDGMYLIMYIYRHHVSRPWTQVQAWEYKVEDDVILFQRFRSVQYNYIAPDPFSLGKQQLQFVNWTRLGDYRKRSDVYHGSFPKPASFHFVNGEYATFLNAADQGIFLNGSASRWSSAYVRAWEELPQAATNTLANITEGIDLVKDVIAGLDNPAKALREVAKDLADPRNAWLAYRYSYTTTKLDVQEYKRALQAMKKLKTLSGQRIRTAGRFEDETGSYGVVIWYTTSSVLPKGLSEVLSYAGLNLNASNLWDLVPFSFVVDWFLKLSDVFEQFENWTYSAEIVPSEVWFTYASSYDEQEVHYRVPGGRLYIPPAYQTKTASGKTVLMRVADSLSLFT